VFTAATSSAQSPTGKAHVPELFVFKPFLIVNEGCVRDYVKTDRMEGVAKRKALIEVLATGCAKEIHGAYSVQIEKVKAFASVSGRPVEMADCILVTAAQRVYEIYHDYSSDRKRDQPFIDQLWVSPPLAHGWAPRASLLTLPRSMQR
jgi:hypothetical protein